MKKILWLSRHAMTDIQREDLISHDEIVHINFTFVAEGEKAAEQIRTLCREHGTKICAGVFPAHVIAALHEQCIEPGSWDLAWKPRELRVLIPVSVPIFSEEGEVRRFEFSHWHMCHV